MKKMLSLAAVVVAMSAGGSMAGDNLCEFTQRQIDRGFTETAVPSTTYISRTIGGGRNCQDATVTTLVVTCINQAGNVMDTRSFTTEPEEGDWGPSYTNTGSCNY